MKFTFAFFILIIVISISISAQEFQLSWDLGSWQISQYLNYPISISDSIIYGDTIYTTYEMSILDITLFFRDLNYGLSVSIVRFYDDSFKTYTSVEKYSILPFKIFYAISTPICVIRAYFSGGILFTENFKYQCIDATIGIDASTLFSPPLLLYSSINSIFIGFDITRIKFFMGISVDLSIILVLLPTAL